ncbi:MAG TPA: pyridoxal phosphate-dependent aminotransferase, partial [Thermoanaerobaculia bacterium]
EEVRRWLLEAAGIGVVPFQAFGSTEDTGWFRLSVGAVSRADIEAALPRLEAALRRQS